MKTVSGTVFACWLLLALAAALAAEPVDLQLRLAPGETRVYAETWRGRGELVRHQGETDQKLALEASAENERVWRVDELTEAGARCRAESRRSKAGLTLVEARREYRRERPWRAFALTVGPRGTVGEWEVLAPEPPHDQPGENEPPVDFDLGELLVLAELGLLPPRPLAVGERWQWPPPPKQPPAPGEREPRRPVTVSGRLLTLSEGEQPLATLETQVQVVLAPRPTAAREITLNGTLNAVLRVRFATAAGCVETVDGPLDVSLRYERAGQAVATVRLGLAVEARRQPPTAGART